MTIMSNPLFYSLLVGALVGAASAYLGSLMVLKRLGLVGDALSHVALPGIGIALTWHLNPFLGAFTALALGVLIIWQIGRVTSIPTESIVGLIFAVALAVGLLVTPEPELLEALFGDISKVVLSDLILTSALTTAVIILTVLMRRVLMLGILSRDFAKAQGVKVDLVDLLFLSLVAIVVALGVKVVGTLLMGALVVIPAISAKNLSTSFRTYGVISVIFGIISAVGGIVFASYANLPPGPMVVLTSAGIFLLSFFFRRTS